MEKFLHAYYLLPNRVSPRRSLPNLLYLGPLVELLKGGSHYRNRFLTTFANFSRVSFLADTLVAVLCIQWQTLAVVFTLPTAAWRL